MNRQIVLVSRPRGTPVLENFTLVESKIPEPGPGQFVIEHHFLGLAPAARIRMGESDSYAPPLPIGGVVYGQAVGRIRSSRHPDYHEGDLVVSTDGGWQDFSLADGSRTSRVDTSIAPETAWLGVLGVSGMTAYVGLLDIAKPKPTDTVVVSAGSGAVGSAVGQIAKILGCKVVGIAGGLEKCRYVVDELGLDACIDHRSPTFAASLSQACSDKIDVYFENVGGAVRDTVWPLMNDFGRISVCGLISEYSATSTMSGPAWFHLLTKRLTVQGFLTRDHQARYSDFISDMGGWYRDGRVKVREHIADGLEQTPAAFIAMLQGRNFGKTMVRLKRQ